MGTSPEGCGIIKEARNGICLENIFVFSFLIRTISMHLKSLVTYLLHQSVEVNDNDNSNAWDDLPFVRNSIGAFPLQ